MTRKAALLGVVTLLPTVLARNVYNVLIYSYTAGFRHDSIPTAIQAMVQRGQDYGINFVSTEDPDKFTVDYLSQFDGLFFLQNTEDVLTESGQYAFQTYLDSGGNFIAAHATANCMLHWPTMERTLGSQFAYHPAFQNATMVVQDPDHPSTKHLPQRWTVEDEVYNFNHDPRDLGAKVVLTVDEDSYEDYGDRSPTQGSPHPIAWYMEELKGTDVTGPVGRSWYTGLGHSNSSWLDDTFMDHIMGGLTWALESNTTRALNPNSTVGSLGPVYTPPPPAPTTTVSITRPDVISGAATSASLSLVVLTTLSCLVWGLHM